MKDVKLILRISAVPLLIVIAVLILISTFTLTQLEESIEDNVITGMQSSVESKLELLRSYFDSVIRESFILTHNPLALDLIDFSNKDIDDVDILSNRRELLAEYLDTIIYDSDIYESFIFIDAKGQFVIDASHGAYQDFDYFEMDFYVSAQRGSRSIQDVIVSPITDQSVLIVGNPVFSKENEVIGTAGTLIKFDDLVKKIVRTKDDDKTYGIIDRHGVVIAAELESFIFNQESLEVDTATFETIKAQKTGFLFADSEFGEQLIIYRVVPEKNWYLYTSVPVEAYQNDIKPIRRVIISILFFSIVILGAVVISSAQLKASNTQYLEALDRLKSTQEELVMSRKIASLGSLVTGVAHEINTPIGNSILVASHLQEKAQVVQEHFLSKKMTQSELRDFITLCIKTASNISMSVSKVSVLIKGFKKLSDLKYYEEKQLFRVKRCLEEAIIRKRMVMNLEHVHFEVSCDDTLEIVSIKEALSQTIENLIENTIVHAYDADYNGVIKIVVENNPDNIEIRFMDLGRGIEQELIPKIFDPFFTTKLSGDRSGLGLYIVYNIVNYVLNGHIKCMSDIDVSTEFIITLPKNNSSPSK